MASPGRAFFRSAHASDTYFATVPGLVPRCPAIIRFVHPLKPQISDSTSYPRHFADHRQAAFRPAPVSGQAGPAPGGSPATSSGHPAGRTRFRRRCSRSPADGYRAQQPAFVSGRQPAIMSHRTAANLKASRTASSAARRSPRLARRVVRTCLPDGSRRRRRCRWRAGPGCRVPVMAEPGIRTLRIPSPHRGGSHEPWIKTWTWRPQVTASRCTLETGEGERWQAAASKARDCAASCG